MAALRLRDPVTAVPGETAPVVWVLHDGKPGMASQALGLAEATGFPFIEKQLSVRPPWAWLPPQLWLAPFGGGLTAAGPPRAPWPGPVIGRGPVCALAAPGVPRAHGGRPLAPPGPDPRG